MKSKCVMMVLVVVGDYQMINHEMVLWLKNEFNIDFYDEIAFSSIRRVSFVIDIDEKPLMCRVVTGQLSSVSLPDWSYFPVNDLFQYVDENNLLAEVEGRHNFIQNIRQKFNTFDQELYLYIPVKRNFEPLWLYMSFTRHLVHGKHFVFAQVVRIYEQTPVEIIHYQKTYQDPLTKLFTRETLKLHMNNLSSTDNAYVMYLDVDDFKYINDQYGHQTGDQFLIDIANYFIGKWEYNVLYYRLGGDEFFMYCYDHTLEQIETRAKQLIYDIENLNDISKTIGVSVSIGIVKITDQNKGYHSLLNLGDKTMYVSKAKGKGSYTLYQPSENE